MPKDKLIHTVPMSINDQRMLMEELQSILHESVTLSPDSSAFLKYIVRTLQGSITQCSEKERQYEQAVKLERGDL